MDGVGGLAGWKWIFVLEGIVTMLFSIMAWYFLPSDIASASFLTPEEREFAGEFVQLSVISYSLTSPKLRVSVLTMLHQHCPRE